MTALIVVAALVGWLVLATAVGLVIGRVIRRREQQVPQQQARAGKPEPARTTSDRPV